MPNDQEPLPYNSIKPRSVSIPAIISLALGILAIPAVCAYFIGVIFGLAAIVTGIIAVFRIRKSVNLTGMGLAVTGIILGILSLLLATACGVMLSGLH